MLQEFDSDASGQVSELAIVDTFTKLIFGVEDEYSDGELMIVQALRLADDNIALDERHEMGGYLRALSVSEMIRLVSQVKQSLNNGSILALQEAPAAARATFIRH